MKNVAILGSTGSIGTQALDVCRAFPDQLRVLALAAGRNTDLLRAQVREFAPRCVFGEGLSRERPDWLGNARLCDMTEMVTAEEIDLVLVSTSGSVALRPVLAAIRAGKTVAVANKEVLVTAGEILTREARARDRRILPVDSEHSALLQCLAGEDARSVARIIITASGGPFRRFAAEQLTLVTPEQALKHPNWQMGRKVTIDSATLLNKGLEVIEARWLFDTPYERIDVVVHPESVVHGLVEFTDGSIKAHLGAPDMRIPIQYALSYPERWSNQTWPRLDLLAQGRLTFEPPDYGRFPCLALALEAGRKGGTYPAVLSSADEVAVELLLAGRIGFQDIPRLIEEALTAHHQDAHPSLEDIEAAQQWTYGFLRDRIAIKSTCGT
ncbi:MAG: 1-deoxy-D-xylulose-5-phosphate reductoisomerase [Chloroflexota bacterium]|nr:MAG: 1-deoxy-D-xylulose-5-phosphate reductoisomerase [Chloroflexota bacterium]